MASTELRAAAQQALEALEAGLDVDPIVAGETADALRAALAEPQEPVAWTPVTEAMPKSGVKVLACYRNRLGNLRRIRAMWTAAKTEEASSEDAEACSEYDEATDTYYVTEGWYECIDNWGDYSSVAVTEGEVTHWMPLPPDPDSAPPQRPAEPVQEPIGYLWPTGRHPEFRFTQQKRDGVDGTPVYTAPPQIPAQPSLAPDAETAWKMGYEAGKRDANGVLDLSPPPRPVKPVAHVQRMGSYQGVPAYGCLLTLEAEKRMKVNDPLYGQAELEAFGAQIAVDVRMRCAQIADAHASCDGIAQVIAAEIRGQA